MTRTKPRFPIQERYVYLAHCGVSPLHPEAMKRETGLARAHMETGARAFADYVVILDNLRRTAATLLRTHPDNLSFVKNTSEALGLLANGYPFQQGDEIISYVHEYPANHYPWRLQEQRGVVLRVLPNRTLGADDNRPCRWLISDLEAMISSRTRVVALSHVQFTSGYAADLRVLGDLCRARGVDLVVDAAQSLGALPVYPDEYGIAAVASSGWKWLMGPVGTGLMYTSPELRKKLRHVLVGAELMEQGLDYLDHTWRPLQSGKRFEYSTSPVALALGLEAAISGNVLSWGVEAIRDELFRLQDVLIRNLDPALFEPLIFPSEHRSGILSVRYRSDTNKLLKYLEREDIVVSERGGYLRIAPHYYNTDHEMNRAAEALNRTGTQA